MKEATLTVPSTSASHYSYDGDVQEYQVDSVSISPCEDTDSDSETDNTLVVSGQPALPTIESVSVVNSNDVHIGNKTVYQGPVTIKQIVYPNAPSTDCVNSLCENKVVVKKDFSVDNGIDNPTFEKDSPLRNKRSNGDKDIIQSSDAQHTLTGIQKGIDNRIIVGKRLLE